ncbi:hypothetical protein JXB41_07725 [Candidatus Woesearchaeota archaeon]|nr:hypothetical protein [Candidatus Woesearchaeota archaeon]
MKLIVTRFDKTVSHPVYDERPIWVSTHGHILDGHGRYFSHTQFGTPLEIREFKLTPLGEIDLEKLILTKPDFKTYSPEGLATLLEIPILVEHDNYGLYIVKLGNTRVYRFIDHGKESIKAYGIEEI